MFFRVEMLENLSSVAIHIDAILIQFLCAVKNSRYDDKPLVLHNKMAHIRISYIKTMETGLNNSD